MIRLTPAATYPGRRLPYLPLACAVATACTLLPNDAITVPANAAAPLSAPRPVTRAVEFTAFVQEMTTRQQQVLNQINRATATNAGSAPAPLAAGPLLAAAAPAAAAAVPGTDVIGAIGARVLNAFRGAAETAVALPAIYLLGSLASGSAINPLILAAYVIASPVIAAVTFVSILVTGGLPPFLTAAAAGPAPVAATPRTTAATVKPPAPGSSTPAPSGTTEPAGGRTTSTKAGKKPAKSGHKTRPLPTSAADGNSTQIKSAKSGDETAQTSRPSAKKNRHANNPGKP